MKAVFSCQMRCFHWLQEFSKVPFLFLAIFLVLSCLPIRRQPIELLTHFKLQYCGGSLCLVVLYALTCAWRWMAAALLCVFISGISFIGFYSKPAHAITHAVTGKHLRLLLMNVLYKNKDYPPALALIQQEQPDLLFFQEFTPAWAENTKSLRETYPYGLVDAQERASGQAVLSRLPLARTRVLDVSSRLSNTLELTISLGAQTLTVIAAHPPTPIEGFAYRNEQLQEMAVYLSHIDTPKILIGDLNITMWSPYFQETLGNAGLCNGRKGFGILPTWPVGTRLPFLRIPLDHCLVSCSIQVEQFRLGSDIGSDHLPIIVDLVLPQ